MMIPLAQGTFSELEAKLGPAKDKFKDFNAAHPELVGNSVRVRGTIKHNGQPVAFDFRAPVRAKLEDGVRSATRDRRDDEERDDQSGRRQVVSRFRRQCDRSNHRHTRQRQFCGE